MNISLSIKERRKILDLTQEDLAEMSTVGLRTIKQIESGEGNPSLKTILKIADVLGMELIMSVKKIGE